MKPLRSIAAVALLLSACGAPAPDANTSSAECYVSSDCGGERVCRANICTVAETAPRALGFRLVPPPTSTYPSQTVAVRELAPDMPVQIGLDPGVRVAGEVTWIGSEAGPGAGQLKFRRHGDDFTAQAVVQANAYELYVPAGNYDVTFLPANTSRPTHVWKNVMVELDTDPRLQLSNKEVRVVGTLARTDGLSRDSAFIARAKVFATAVESGITSSVSVTDESGNFELVVPEDAGLFNLHVAPSEPNAYSGEGEQRYVPEATFEGAFEVDGSDWENKIDGQDSDLLAVSLGEYSYIPVSIPISLELDGQDVDWSGTSVTLKTTAGLGVVSVRQQIEASGEFQLPLISGIYEAIVRTPPELPARSMRLGEISVSAEGVTLSLESRANASGTVLGPNGQPIDAELRFVPLSDNLAQQISVRTDEDGTYGVFLDDEPYTLTVVPSDSTLPRRVMLVENGDVPETIELAEPVLVWGSVFGTPSEASQDWIGLSDVAVNVVEKVDGAERVVGEGQTNEDGDFKVVIGAR